MIQDTISDFLTKKIDDSGFEYELIDNEKRDECLGKIMRVLLDSSTPFSGEHRFNQWEKGWQENFDEYVKNDDDKFLLPKYYGKYDIVRINHDFVRVVSKDFEARMISMLTYYVADKYLRDVKNIFEFGCGPGHNLLKLREVNSEAAIWGLDWVTSSQKTVEKLAEKHIDHKILAKQFDYFNPDHQFKLPASSGILTVASLEQTGDNYKKFIDYILENKPDICVHIEPIAELLDQNILLDYLSVEYFKKRKYLTTFLDYLRELETLGRVKIIEAKRTNAGSFFIDGHSMVVWKPL